MHPASVTNAASRLEAAGLVARRPDPSDGRGVLVQITEEGTIHALRRDRFTLRMLAAAERAGVVSVEWETGRIAVR